MIARCRACTILLWLAGATCAAAQGPATPQRDFYGDPLPDGAIARLGSVRFHPPAGLIAMAYAPDGKSILAIGGDSMRYWDADTGKELARFDGGKEARFANIRTA